MAMKTPVIVINFKVYSEVDGQRCYDLVSICDDIASQYGANIVICPPMPYLAKVVEIAKNVPVFAQHVDPIRPGSHTGYVTAESIKASGASGTLINHSEHRLILADIDLAIGRCKEVGLETIVCTNNIATSKAAATLNPDYVAVEPPELIGGDISVTTASPEIVSGTVEAIKELNPKVEVLCGAGVKTGKDVAKAIELGTVGVLLASGVTKAQDPRRALEDLVSGL